MRRETGFTLLEVLLVAALLSVLAAVLVPHLGVGLRVWSTTDKSMEVIQYSRIALGKILKDIRNAEQITDISSEEVSLISRDGDTITYGIFYLEGQPYLGYSLNGSEWNKLVGPVDWIQMEFYDQSGNSTDQPSLVRSAKISFSVDGESFSSRVYRATDEDIESYVPGVFIPYAITGGFEGVEMKGSGTVTGSNGTIRANGNIKLKGSVTVTGDVISAGECTLSGNPTVGGTIQSYADPMEIPDVDPWSLYDMVQYVLSSNGKVYDSEGHLVGNKEFGAWKFKGGKWKISGHEECNGIYFVMTDVNISGTVDGTITIISTGKIKSSGASNLKTATAEGYLMLSAKKVELSGSGNYEGLILGMEVKVSGGVSVKGALIGNEVKMTGSGTVEFNGEYQIPSGEAKLHILSWDEE